jgi:hypothetical protein
MRYAPATIASLFSKRNLGLAMLVGPVLTFLSIGVGVTDQRFDAVAGPLGVLLIIVLAASLSLVAFSITAVIAGIATASLIHRRASVAARAVVRVIFAVSLSAMYFLAFKVTDISLELFLVTILAALLTLLIRVRTPTPRADPIAARRDAA